MAAIMVTGATGFVGTHLCRTLSGRGEHPVAAVRTAGRPGSDEQRIVGDLAARPELAAALVGIDCVVHLAGRAHVMHESATDPEQAFRRANVEATAHLARAAAAAGVRRFVFLSSVKVNGERTGDRPFREMDPPAPEDAYGRSKWAAEQALRQIAADTGLEVVVIRPPLVYGPGVKANFLRLMQLVDRGVSLPFGSVVNRRSLVNLDNLCDLIHAAAQHPDAVGETFLVSDQQDVSTPELIRMLASALGRRARLWPVPAPLLAAAAGLLRREAAYARVAGSLQVDSGKASRLLGWRPATAPTDALRVTADWYRQQFG
jgi:UDP-glucose 4-epimerase